MSKKEPKFINITEDEFDEKFTITGSGFEEDRYETYGEELEAVSEIFKKTPRKVWTAVDIDEAPGIAFVSGMAFVNRQYYFVTKEEVPEGVEYSVKLDSE